MTGVSNSEDQVPVNLKKSYCYCRQKIDLQLYHTKFSRYNKGPQYVGRGVNALGSQCKVHGFKSGSDPDSRLAYIRCEARYRLINIDSKQVLNWQ